MNISISVLANISTEKDEMILKLYRNAKSAELVHQLWKTKSEDSYFVLSQLIISRDDKNIRAQPKSSYTQPQTADSPEMNSASLTSYCLQTCQGKSLEERII